MIGVGDKVVCIAGFEDREDKAEIDLPIVGCLYTVRGLYSDHQGDGLWLEEIVNPRRRYSNGYLEATFQVDRFRKVTTPKTDIEIFRKIDRDVFDRVDA